MLFRGGQNTKELTIEAKSKTTSYWRRRDVRSWYTWENILGVKMRQYRREIFYIRRTWNIYVIYHRIDTFVSPILAYLHQSFFNFLVQNITSYLFFLKNQNIKNSSTKAVAIVTTTVFLNQHLIISLNPDSFSPRTSPAKVVKNKFSPSI